MDEKVVSYGEIFTDETFEGIRKSISGFLDLTGASNATFQFPNKTVYLHRHPGTVEVHIVDATSKESPELPEDENEEEA